MKKIFLLFVIMPFVFNPFILFAAEPGRLDQRDIVVDNAIGGMREGSRMVAPDRYGQKAEITQMPGTQLAPGDINVTNAGVSVGVSENTPGISESTSGGSQVDISFSNDGSSVEVGGPGEIGPGSGPDIETDITTETGGSLIDIDAGVGLGDDGLQTDVNVGIDIEEREQILDADISADSEFSSEITDSAISSGSDIGTEVDTSGSSVGSEADMGVEADIEGGGAGDDVADDPADGLSTTTTGI